MQKAKTRQTEKTQPQKEKHNSKKQKIIAAKNKTQPHKEKHRFR